MSEKKTCTFEGCDKPARAKGLCGTHYAKHRKQARTTVDTSPMRIQGTVPVERLGEFQYTASEGDLQYWEGNPGASPLAVPEEIKKRNPGFDFHWCSDKKWEKFGPNYQGWQRFTSPDHPEGLRRGNDLFLAAMPKERAQRYRDHVSEQSIERLRSTQEKALTAQIGSNMSAQELAELGAQGATPGITIGQRARTKSQFGNRTIMGGGFVRGMKRSEVAEIVRKEIADRKKNRVYSFAK